MEEGLKTDFDDLLREDLVKEAPAPEVPATDAEQARSQLLAAVAALELAPAMSDEALEAQALADAIEQERLERED